MFLLDMNVSPLWVHTLASGGFEVEHWSRIGRASAPDEEILRYAASRGATIFTHDLDFGISLARTGAKLPSVVQVRSNDVLPAVIGAHVVESLQRLHSELLTGCLITIDPRRTRVRILPIDSFTQKAR